MVKDNIVFTDISIFSSDGHFVLQSRTIFAILVQCTYYEELFYEIILNFCQWLRKRCHLMLFLFLAQGAILLRGADWFVQFLVEYYEEHFCEISFNFGPWLRRCLLKIFLFFSSGGHFVWQSGTINLCNFYRGHYGEHLSEFILNLD